MLDDKPLSVPRDIDLRLDTSPITAVDALGNPPVGVAAPGAPTEPPSHAPTPLPSIQDPWPCLGARGTPAAR